MTREPEPIHFGGPKRRDPVGLYAAILCILMLAITIFAPRNPDPTCTPTETKATP